MSQINFRESAEGMTILGRSGGKSLGNLKKLHLKIHVFVHSGSNF